MGEIRTRSMAPIIAAVTAGLLVLFLVSTAAATSAAVPAMPGRTGQAATADDEAETVAVPVDPPASPSYVPVRRPGKVTRRGGPASRGGFTPATPATYADGVSVRVVRVVRSAEQGHGQGVFQGRPHVALTFFLTNGSSEAVDLSQVVVTTRYGSPPLAASPVYEDAAASDFSGSVPPGATVTATYVFSVPWAQAGSAVVVVDLDGSHAPATFAGLS